MTDSKRWLLPDGIDEVLPPRAWQVETLRRRLLDIYRGWGYQLVMTPFMEYLESLLTGVGSDLDLQTFKVTDQLSGRTLGIRADITPQVARIDAHSIQAEGVTRLSYSGSVLGTRPQSASTSRSPFQIGAELFGCNDISADIEVVSLMLETLKLAGLEEVYLDLGHVGIYRALVAESNLTDEQQAEYFELLRRKAKADLRAFVEAQETDPALAANLIVLADLHGGVEVLQQARQQLSAVPASVEQNIDYLQTLADAVRRDFPEVTLYFDLGELRGYQYHTGAVYSAYVPGHGQAVAKGGRYDDIGHVFGRARAATGFSADLKTLIDLTQPLAQDRPILAPMVDDPALAQQVKALREAGEVVINELQSEVAGTDAKGQRRLVEKDGQWHVEPD